MTPEELRREIGTHYSEATYNSAGCKHAAIIELPGAGNTLEEVQARLSTFVGFLHAENWNGAREARRKMLPIPSNIKLPFRLEEAFGRAGGLLSSRIRDMNEVVAAHRTALFDTTAISSAPIIRINENMPLPQYSGGLKRGGTIYEVARQGNNYGQRECERIAIEESIKGNNAPLNAIFDERLARVDRPPYVVTEYAIKGIGYISHWDNLDHANLGTFKCDELQAKVHQLCRDLLKRDKEYYHLGNGHIIERDALSSRERMQAFDSFDGNCLYTSDPDFAREMAQNWTEEQRIQREQVRVPEQRCAL